MCLRLRKLKCVVGFAAFINHSSASCLPFAHAVGALHGWKVHFSSIRHHGRTSGWSENYSKQDELVGDNRLLLKTPLVKFVPDQAVFWYFFSLVSFDVCRGAAGYCFVELADEATAERCLRKVNGKPLPGATPVRFPTPAQPPSTVSVCEVWVFLRHVNTNKRSLKVLSYLSSVSIEKHCLIDRSWLRLFPVHSLKGSSLTVPLMGNRERPGTCTYSAKPSILHLTSCFT